LAIAVFLAIIFLAACGLFVTLAERPFLFSPLPKRDARLRAGPQRIGEVMLPETSEPTVKLARVTSHREPPGR
jgi:hypothetical protein